jgi:hypothetical protein
VIEGPNEAGQVRLTGAVLSNSQVFALNERTNLAAGQQTGQNGEYDFLLGAREGDFVTFWYVKDTDLSPTIGFVVRPTSGSGGADAGSDADTGSDADAGAGGAGP